MENKEEEEYLTLNDFISHDIKCDKYYKRVNEIIESNEEASCCSYSKGYHDQEVFHCITCATGPSAICMACYLQCHLDHDVVQLGWKREVKWDCGNSLHKQKCALFGEKDAQNDDNLYNHNNLGRFCICDTIDDETTRGDTMVMCVGCTDWLHINCIQNSNLSHNLAPPEFIQPNIPGIPEDVDNWDFFCQRCVQRLLFVPSSYKSYIYYESFAPEKRQRVEGSWPLVESMEKFPYHIFLSQSWLQERCMCENCTKLYDCDSMYFLLHGPKTDEGLMQQIEDEGEKIFTSELEESEIPDNPLQLIGAEDYPHDVQVQLAQGINLFKETLAAAMIQRNEMTVGDVEAFKDDLFKKLDETRRNRRPE